MTTAETKLHQFLSSEPTRLFTKEEIAQAVFPEHVQEETPLGIGVGATRLVDQTATGLREQLLAENPAARRVINVWGIGYRFKDGI